MENSSKFKDLLSLLFSIKGDLSHALSPPFLLAPKSMIETPTAWTERPSLFAEPALEPDPARRALKVLKWMLVTLKSTFHVGHQSKLGMQKPLNSFLGELCIGTFTDKGATVHLVAEQVSHHPPIGACYFWDEEHGISCEGFSQVEMTFNGQINLKQQGQSIVYIKKYDEYYLTFLPDLKVVGFLSGRLYPEFSGKYSIVSSSGYISEIDFKGKGFLAGEKNTFTAKVYSKDEGPERPLYTLSGQWSGKFEIIDCMNPNIVESYDITHPNTVPMTITPEAEQDPFETHKAWKKVREAIKKGDMQAIGREKSKIEEAQRAMRKKEAAEKTQWKPVFFTKHSGNQHPKIQELLKSSRDPKFAKIDSFWKVDEELARHHQRPFHGMLTPGGS